MCHDVFWKNVYPEQWKGSGGQTTWLDPASVFSSLDFYVWENLKPIVCVTQVT